MPGPRSLISVWTKSSIRRTRIPRTLIVQRRIHRIQAVSDEIDQNLLNLDAIERDKRKVAFDIDVHTNAAPRSLLGHEVARFGNDARERRAAPRLHGLPEQGADAADDIRRRVGVPDDALDRDLRALDVRRLGGQPTLAGVGVRDDRGQGLVHLVGDRSRELCKACGLL